jgi:hypothetical protein
VEPPAKLTISRACSDGREQVLARSSKRDLRAIAFVGGDRQTAQRHSGSSIDDSARPQRSKFFLIP